MRPWDLKFAVLGKDPTLPFLKFHENVTVVCINVRFIFRLLFGEDVNPQFVGNPVQTTAGNAIAAIILQMKFEG